MKVSNPSYTYQCVVELDVEEAEWLWVPSLGQRVLPLSFAVLFAGSGSWELVSVEVLGSVATGWECAAVSETVLAAELPGEVRELLEGCAPVWC